MVSPLANLGRGPRHIWQMYILFLLALYIFTFTWTEIIRIIKTT